MSKEFPTEEEMTAVLLEFHQRNLREAPRETGVPKPFLIQTDVQSVGPSSLMGYRRSEDTRVPVAQNAFVKPETDFQLNQYSYGHNPGAPWFIITFQLNCGNMGTISDGLYILPLYSYWEAPAAPPPGNQGNVAIRFNGSTWVPPPPNETPEFPAMQGDLQGTLPATGAINIHLALTMKHSTGVGDYVEHIHTAGSPFWSEDNVSYPARIVGIWGM